MTMLSLNGHEQGHDIASSPPDGAISVPEALRPRLLALTEAHARAKADLAAFLQSLMVVMGLPPDTIWGVETETMLMTQRGPAHNDVTAPE